MPAREPFCRRVVGADRSACTQQLIDDEGRHDASPLLTLDERHEFRGKASALRSAPCFTES